MTNIAEIPENPEADDADLQPSKTRRKRDMHALQGIGAQLVDLTQQQLAALALPDKLTDAVADAKQMRKLDEARRRQMQYIGKLMRGVDPEPIKARLDAWRGVSNEHTAQLHAVERWRVRLLEDETAFAALASHYPTADLQHLRALARNARKEHAANRPPKSFRLLFQQLRALLAERSDD
ncbi:MAG: DUF615 domain-containing protein [Burkholderiales bacterium]|nr:DUF615 domain-containing protein [Burkholderiales bacterium]